MSRRWRWTFQHGHSAWREDGNYSPQLNSETLAPVLRELAPGAEFVVGMSLGGLTAIRLAAMAPDLVGELVLVDVTPSALQRHAELTAEQRGTVALMHGEREFPSFQAMLDLTIAAAPHRDIKSLRRGVFHNSRRLDNAAIHRREPEAARAACIGRSELMAQTMLAELFRRRVLVPPEGACPGPFGAPIPGFARSYQPSSPVP